MTDESAGREQSAKFSNATPKLLRKSAFLAGKWTGCDAKPISAASNNPVWNAIDRVMDIAHTELKDICVDLAPAPLSSEGH